MNVALIGANWGTTPPIAPASEKFSVRRAKATEVVISEVLP